MAQKTRDHVLGLVSRPRCERLLYALTNYMPPGGTGAPVPPTAEEQEESMEELKRAYQGGLMRRPASGGRVPDQRALELVKLYPEIFSRFVFGENTRYAGREVRSLGSGLRKIWDCTDHWHRNALIYDLERRYFFDEEIYRGAAASEGSDEAYTAWIKNPITYEFENLPVTPLRAVLVYLQANEHRMRHCPSSTCGTPYFLLTKKGQTYCSPRCADPARRASKRASYHRNKKGVA